MLSLTDIFSVSSALGDTDLDVDLRALLGLRAWDVYVMHEGLLGTDVQIFVVQGGDTAEVINDSLGFSITGDQAEDPSFLSIEDFGQYHEIAYAPDDGPHLRVFVENSPETELGIHHMCLSHFWPGEEDAS